MGNRLERGDGTFDGCFGCGLANPKGLALVFAREGDEIVSRVVVDGAYAGYKSFVHGGIVAAMLDEAQGWALLNLADTYGVTRGLNILYRRPVAVGRPLVVRARVQSVEGTSVYLQSQIEDERGRLLASAEGHWVKVRRERALKKGND